MNAALHHKLNYRLLVLTAFVLPWGKFIPVVMVLLLLSWLLEGRFMERFRQVEHKNALYLIAGFYLLHLLGMLYTANQDSGWFDLEIKLPLLIFPLALSTVRLGKEEQAGVLAAFVYGCIGISGFLLAASLYDHYSLGQDHFFYEEFARWLHPGYLAMYLNMGICVILLQLYKGDGFNKYVSLLTVLFLCFIIFLLSSKMGILCTATIFAGMLLYIIVKKKKIWLGLAGFAFILFSFFIVTKYIPEVGARFHAVKQALLSDTDKTNPESNNVRLLIWQTDAKIIGKNLLTGVGTGDVKDELLNSYFDNGITGAYKLDEETGKPSHVLNAHNQFLQSFIALGITGFLVLLTLVVFPGILGIRQKLFLPFAFSFIVLFNFLTESVLEREAGMMFFAFFFSLFFTFKSVEN